jgi:CTP synthase (UTP-ammonia lyase)
VSALRIGIVGDRDGAFRPHVATDEALGHTATALGVAIDVRWVPTPSVLAGGAAVAAYDGLWIAPGSPYASLDGALAAIRFARERGWPLVAT